MIAADFNPRALSRRTFVSLLGAGAAGTILSPAARAANVPADTGVIGQSRVGEAACGPCALANALTHGDPGGREAFQQLSAGSADGRVETIISLYGTKSSETYGSRRMRYSADAGLTAEDMPYLANEVLEAHGQSKARGDWLDSPGNEDEHAHLRRIHDLFTTSLARGLPPIIEIRAFSADPGSSRGAMTSMSWVNLFAHWLALVSVDPVTLPPRASGFFCRFADSYTGRIIPGFATAELYRPFNATKGFSLKPDGTKEWHWLTGHPFVLLDLPDLPLTIQSRPWHERTFVAMTYAVHR